MMVEFHFPTKTVKLNSGYEMPIIGLGTWALYGNICKESVYQSIKMGYRLIDTAQLYENENLTISIYNTSLTVIK